MTSASFNNPFSLFESGARSNESGGPDRQAAQPEARASQQSVSKSRMWTGRVLSTLAVRTWKSGREGLRPRVVSPVRIERTTHALKGRCSTN